MPIEQRKILFSLHEMQTILTPYQMDFSNSIPSNPGQYQIMEALHTRDLPKTPHDIVGRLKPGIDMAKKQGAEAVVFRAFHANSGKEFFFIVPDKKMEKILIKECQDLHISLPRKGQKLVVAEDLYVGLRLDIAAESDFELEE